jgi:hypothetical protein
MCAGSRFPPRGNPQSSWRNLLDSELPLPQRLGAFAANNWWKISHRQGCCGHYGEPGC